MHWSSATGAACPKKKLSCKFIAFYVMIERRLIEMKISNATKFIEFIHNLGRSRLGLLQCTFCYTRWNGNSACEHFPSNHFDRNCMLTI